VQVAALNRVGLAGRLIMERNQPQHTEVDDDREIVAKIAFKEIVWASGFRDLRLIKY